MSTAERSSAARTRRHRERRRHGVRCASVDVSQGELDALVAGGYLSEEERDNGAALKNAIEALISDVALELRVETAERSPQKPLNQTAETNLVQ
jgi:hypothetical protein